MEFKVKRKGAIELLSIARINKFVIECIDQAIICAQKKLMRDYGFAKPMTSKSLVVERAKAKQIFINILKKEVTLTIDYLKSKGGFGSCFISATAVEPSAKEVILNLSLQLTKDPRPHEYMNYKTLVTYNYKHAA